MAIPNALDMSTYGQELTATEAECMAAAGIELVIAGTGHRNSLGKWSEQQAGAALAAGMVLDGYRWLNLNEPVVPQMDNAFRSMGEHVDDVRMWWIDCEDTTMPGMGPAEVLDAIGDAVEYCERRGVAHGIYSGRWWWGPQTNNSDMFKYLPLWNAYYDGDPDEDGLPYGGWEHSAIEQYTGTTMVCGQSVDKNYAKNLTPPATGDLEELVLLIASVVGGRPDGVPFQTVEEALVRFRQLELQDQRVLMGLGLTQELISTHIDTPTLLGGAHAD